VADEDSGGRLRRFGARARKTAKRIDEHPALLRATQLARERLPGDSAFGDSLSTAGDRGSHAMGRHLSELTAKRPGVLRETGLTALQVWEAVSESQGRGKGKLDVAVVFTDLVGFSDWALEAGDDAAIELLRQVDNALGAAVKEHRGEVVKRLGDGMMAAFASADDAVTALMAARSRLERIEVEGHCPRLRSGLHVGRPRKIGGDYFGVDVNIAARLAEQASPDELLVSEPTLQRVDCKGLQVSKRRRFKVKGVPDGLEAYALVPSSAA
jgi:adenylate cyclase